MKSLLYIRHAYHSKTKSNDFLIDILKSSFNITLFDIDPYTQNIEEMLKSVPAKDFDVLLLFQLPIDGNLIKKYIKFKKGVFFPMFDGAPDRKNHIWLSWKDFNIINFSKTLHLELLNLGLSSFYIQYFPKPIDVELGNEKSVFFWHRITKLNINIFEKIFKSLSIENVHIHKATDPQNEFVNPTLDNLNIEYSTWYNSKNDMLKDIEKCSIYIAPRLYEGIGMSFLEAMGMGRCVIATDTATMNEYIVDGKTGILYDFDNPCLNKQYDIRAIQKNTFNYINDGYIKWEKEKYKIINYIDYPVKIDKMKIILFKIKTLQVIKNLFSITNNDTRTHKILTLMGFCFKFEIK